MNEITQSRQDSRKSTLLRLRSTLEITEIAYYGAVIFLRIAYIATKHGNLDPLNAEDCGINHALIGPYYPIPLIPDQTKKHRSAHSCARIERTSLPVMYGRIRVSSARKGTRPGSSTSRSKAPCVRSLRDETPGIWSLRNEVRVYA
jgi:hypothetical protein